MLHPFYLPVAHARAQFVLCSVGDVVWCSSRGGTALITKERREKWVCVMRGTAQVRNLCPLLYHVVLFPPAPQLLPSSGRVYSDNKPHDGKSYPSGFWQIYHWSSLPPRGRNTDPFSSCIAERAEEIYFSLCLSLLDVTGKCINWLFAAWNLVKTNLVF